MRWLERDQAPKFPYMTLCLTQTEAMAAFRHCNLNLDQMFVNDGANATTHFLISEGETTCVVCLRVDGKKTGVQIAALLVHEAVHIWQEWRRMIGEKVPGDEHEAYSIQSISQVLMTEYGKRARRLGRG